MLRAPIELWVSSLLGGQRLKSRGCSPKPGENPGPLSGGYFPRLTFCGVIRLSLRLVGSIFWLCRENEGNEAKINSNLGGRVGS
jgi:hypothetical protein